MATIDSVEPHTHIGGLCGHTALFTALYLAEFQRTVAETKIVHTGHGERCVLWCVLKTY